jgi:hypothetical protein
MGVALAALAAAGGLGGCSTAFSGTFVVDELTILAVRTQPAEIVYDLDLLRQGWLEEIPVPTQMYVGALAANPESMGGRTGIERYQWTLGDPPLEGTPTLVSDRPELMLQGDSVAPALEIFGGEDGSLSPSELADLLESGPLRIPLVVTAIAGPQSATAVKMLTIRGTDDGVVTPNENPTAEGLDMGEEKWNETELLALQDKPLYPDTELPRGSRIDFTVNPEDDTKDGDVVSTLYTTGGSIMWSSESMRTWWLDVPDDDYPFETFEVFVVLRDLEGAQSWLTVIPEFAP